MQTARGFCWATNDTNFVYTGHMGIWDGKPVSTTPGWGTYEDTPPSQWYSETGSSAPVGESYRRCCTSHSWIAEALSARLMGAMELWNHPAFFGYCDRWMNDTHSDSLAIIAIKAARGWDFSDNWLRHGASWDDITNTMWKTYRNSTTKTTFMPQHRSNPAAGAGMVVYNCRGQVVGKFSVTSMQPSMLEHYLTTSLMLPKGIYLCRLPGESIRVIVRDQRSTTR